MDFSPYRRRHSRLRTPLYNKKFDWTPIAIVLGSIITGILLFIIVKALFLTDEGELYHPSFFSEIGSRGEIQLQQNDDWQFFSHPILLWEGDKVRSLMGEEVWVKFEDQLNIFLSPLSQIELLSSRKKEDSTTSSFSIIEGEIWIEVPLTLNKTPRLILEISPSISLQSTGGTIIASPGSIRLLKENGGINTLVYNNKEEDITFSTIINVGQEIVLSPSNIITAIQLKNFSLQPISPEFYLSNLYQSRTNIDTQSIISAIDSFSPGAQINITESDESELFWDQSATITNPGKSGTTIEVTDPYQKISGIVPPDTQKIYVRYKDEVHTLQKFQPGEETFTYLARPDFNNLEEGENTYEIVVENSQRERSKPIAITIKYTPIPIGTFSITTPNGGKDGPIYSVPQWLEGTAPSNASYIRVNNYTLQKFKKGDKTWNYYAADLTKGPNIFTITALDSGKNIIETKTITLFYTDPSTTITTPTPIPSQTPTQNTSTSEVPRSTPFTSSSSEVSR